MKMTFVASIIRYKLCIIYAFFDFFVQKSLLTKNYLCIAAIIVTTRGPLYTCLIVLAKIFFFNAHKTAPTIFRSLSALSEFQKYVIPIKCVTAMHIFGS